VSVKMQPVKRILDRICLPGDFAVRKDPSTSCTMMGATFASSAIRAQGQALGEPGLFEVMGEQLGLRFECFGEDGGGATCARARSRPYPCRLCRKRRRQS
jgi:hypothetical protein